jgi:Flp pilus assembly pilin Flp
MSLLATLMKQYARDEKGAALVEYAVIFAVLIAGTVTAFGLISPELDRIFQLVADILVGIV